MLTEKGQAAMNSPSKHWNNCHLCVVSLLFLSKRETQRFLSVEDHFWILLLIGDGLGIKPEEKKKSPTEKKWRVILHVSPSKEA